MWSGISFWFYFGPCPFLRVCAILIAILLSIKVIFLPWYIHELSLLFSFFVEINKGPIIGVLWLGKHLVFFPPLWSFSDHTEIKFICIVVKVLYHENPIFSWIFSIKWELCSFGGNFGLKMSKVYISEGSKLSKGI